MDEFEELELQCKQIEEWLNNNQKHPRFDEGFNKLRMILIKMGDIYKEQMKPIVQRLF